MTFEVNFDVLVGATDLDLWEKGKAVMAALKEAELKVKESVTGLESVHHTWADSFGIGEMIILEHKAGGDVSLNVFDLASGESADLLSEEGAKAVASSAGFAKIKGVADQLVAAAA